VHHVPSELILTMLPTIHDPPGLDRGVLNR
jgi:hypothetical protein